MHNDNVCDTGNGKLTAPTLLGVSAAFDTIGHGILLQRFHTGIFEFLAQSFCGLVRIC